MKKITTWIVFICIALGTFAPMIVNAAAKDWAGYDCVAYARARFMEWWGFALHWPGGGAKGYYYNATSFGDIVSNTPKAGVLAVWGDSGAGHVAIVEQVSGNEVYISEGNYSGHYNERWLKLSNMNLNGQQFLGFVYVKGTTTPAPTQDPWIEMWDVTNITEIDAKLNANVRNPGGVMITTVGFSLWDPSGNLMKVLYAPMHETLQTKDNAYLCFWMLADAGIRLTKGTKYKYEIFIIRSDEKAFYSGGFFFQTAGSHTLNFHPEGGSCDIVSKQVINGDVYGSLPMPRRTGYTFIGWYSDNMKIMPDSQFKLSNGLNLYARWIKSSLPGDLDDNGAINISDVMEACKVLARKGSGIQPTAHEMERGNLDGDNDFTIADVMEICKILARQA